MWFYTEVQNLQWASASSISKKDMTWKSSSKFLQKLITE